jgi:preprotein translocase subunit SecD
MRKEVKLLKSWNVIISILITIGSLYYFLPNFVSTDKHSWLPSSKLNLGLDLRGGSHLLLNVDFDKYRADQLELQADSVRQELRNKKLGYKNLQAHSDKISFLLRNSDDLPAIKSVLKSLDNSMIIEAQGDRVELMYSLKKIEDLKLKLLEQSIEIIRMRVDETGTKEPIIQRQGENNILLQVPGLEDPTSLKNLLGKTAKLTFHLIDDSVSPHDAARGVIPIDSVLVKAEGNSGEEYALIKKKSLVTGDLLNDARVGFDNFQQPIVEFAFNTLGAKLFAEVTKSNVGKRLAIVLDNKLLIAPSIKEPIIGGRGSISGNYSMESAGELALLLRSGALPAPLKVIEERTVGPNLGEDSIKAGMLSGIIGFAGVVLFMLWTYGAFGMFANIALTLSLIYLTAILSMFHATLTLPGIAGIILTIGMAVDANVLIYERIREEALKGTSPLYAVKNGFESAFSTIADSNITTLIAAILLYNFGVGAIKGFAVTLTAGIISSMFSAIVITRILIDSWMHIVKPKKLNL